MHGFQVSEAPNGIVEQQCFWIGGTGFGRNESDKLNPRGALSGLTARGSRVMQVVNCV